MKLHHIQSRLRRRVLMVGLTLALVPVVAAVGASPAAADPACPRTAPDRASAAAIARACNGRVEVASARTETGQVFANPDGTATIEQYAYPQRVRKNGSWADLDATLVPNADGSFSPRASIVDLKVSGGGSATLLTGRRAGTEITLSWPGRLPTPKIDGASATYVDVLPGVDLVVTALESGFSEVLVVKSALAAMNPKLRRFAFGSSLSGLRWRSTDGRLEAVDAGGKPVLGSTAPRMWDSSAAPRAEHGGRARGSHAGPAEGAITAPIALNLQDNQITLEPATSMLDNPAVEYPLYLDPTVGYFAWTMINSQFPNQSYWSFDKWDCPSPFTGECAKVGQVYGATMDYRSMWQFSADAFRWGIVTGAKFTIDVLYSAYPSNSQTDLWRVHSDLNSGITWGNTAGAWAVHVGSVWNYSKPAARKLTEFDITGEIQNIASWGWGSVIYGLKANSETSDFAWKKFDAATARLVVTVNNRPGMPDTLTVDDRACATGSGRPVVATATPVLKGRVSDPDGHSMTAFYSWQKWNGSSFVELSGGNNSPWANGSYAQITLGTLEHAGVYAFRMQTNDSPSVGLTGYGISDVSATCEWEVDLQDPVVPTVTGDIYHHSNAGCPPEGCGAVGLTGQFTLSSSSDVTAFRWGLTTPPTNVVNASSGVAQIQWTPLDGGAKTLFVEAVDRAGRTATRNHQFTVAPPTPAAARWRLDDPAGTTEFADDSGNAWVATAQGSVAAGADGRILPGPDGASRSAVGFDGAGGTLTVSGAAMPDTSRSFSVAAWVRVDETSSTRTVLQQNGVNTAAFVLEHNANGMWRFAVTGQDVATPSWLITQSSSPARRGVWTHLAGVYDSGARTLRLYVNGAAEATATGITAWDGNAPLRISGTSPWNGAISDVQVWGRVITPAEAFALADPIGVGKVGEWRMDEVGPGPAFDASGMARDLNFYGGAEIPATGAGQSGTGLRLDGIDDYVSPDLPVLRTDQSFTVSIWARPLPSVTGYQDLLTQLHDGPTPGFVLWYDEVNADWSFRLPTSADTFQNATVVTTPATNVAQYHHLVAVVDLQRREVRLYVDGQLADTEPINAAWQPWQADGRLVIGHGTDPVGNQVSWTRGDVDEVRVYQGVVADVTRIP